MKCINKKLPRQRFHREFILWLYEARSRFIFKHVIISRTNRMIKMGFIGCNPALNVTVSKDEIQVWVSWQGKVEDILTSFEAWTEHTPNGYVCKLCDPTERVIYSNRQELWREHLFERFLEWANQKLAQAELISVYISPGGSSGVDLVQKDIAAYQYGNTFIPVVMCVGAEIETAINKEANYGSE